MRHTVMCRCIYLKLSEIAIYSVLSTRITSMSPDISRGFIPIWSQTSSVEIFSKNFILNVIQKYHLTASTLLQALDN